MVELFLAMLQEHIRRQVEGLPASPGVYLLKDRMGNVLYVGKAASLYSRVASYFRSADKLSARLQKMVGRIHAFDFFITGSEQEAFILECNLIKQHQPRYNVQLKDGKLQIRLVIDRPMYEVFYNTGEVYALFPKKGGKIGKITLETTGTVEEFKVYGMKSIWK